MKTFGMYVFVLLSTICLGTEAPSVTLDEYIKVHNQSVSEGHIGQFPDKVNFFQSLIQKNPWIKNVGEIGFNAGHSSEIFLHTNPDVRVVSFDIMLHPYSRIGKQYIDMKYPGRHTLIEGDSLTSVISFFNKNKNFHFDLIFIDGNHAFNWAYRDIINMKKLASPTTIVITDDITYSDVSKAWNQCIREGQLKEVNRVTCGTGIALGNYVFPQKNKTR